MSQIFILGPLPHLRVLREDAGVCDNGVDLVEVENDVAGRSVELRAVDQDNDLVGALDECKREALLAITHNFYCAEGSRVQCLLDGRALTTSPCCLVGDRRLVRGSRQAALSLGGNLAASWDLREGRLCLSSAGPAA